MSHAPTLVARPRSTSVTTTAATSASAYDAGPGPATAEKNTAPITACPIASPTRWAVCSTPPAVLPDDRVDVRQGERLVGGDHRAGAQAHDEQRAGEHAARRARSGSVQRDQGQRDRPGAEGQRPPTTERATDPGDEPAGGLGSDRTARPRRRSRRARSAGRCSRARAGSRASSPAAARPARGSRAARAPRPRCTTGAGTAAGRRADRPRSRVSRRSRRQNRAAAATAGMASSSTGGPTVSNSTAANSTQNVAAPRMSARARRAGAGRRRVSRQEPSGQDDHHDPDRHVDEEDQPPAEVRPTERDQGAARERPERRAEADGRAQRAEGPSALVTAEHLLHQARDLRVDQAAEDPLEHARGDQQLRGRRQPGHGTGDGEAGHAELEHPLADRGRRPSRPASTGTRPKDSV